MQPAEQSTPRPMFMKVEPLTGADQAGLHAALIKIVGDDPGLSFAVDPESGECTIHGSSELQLDTAIEALRDLGIRVQVGPPQIAYREFVVAAADIDYTHNRRAPHSPEFARVTLRVEPNVRSHGNRLATSLVDDALPQSFITAIEKGITSVLAAGVLIGCPIVDTTVTLLDGAASEPASTPLAFEIAARAAMKNACTRAGLALLEPVMDVEVLTPVDFVQGLVGHLQSLRARIRSTVVRTDGLTSIHADVPLANLFGFVSWLGQLSNGRACHRMTFSHYQEVPRNIAPEPGTFPPAVGMRA